MREPLRTCISSKEKTSKYQLFRIVRTVDNKVAIDYNYNILGRGVYLKKEAQVIKNAQKHNLIQKRLNVEIPEYIYQCLLDYLCDKR